MDIVSIVWVPEFEMDLCSETTEELVHPLLLGRTSMPESVNGRSMMGHRVEMDCFKSLILEGCGTGFLELWYDNSAEDHS